MSRVTVKVEGFRELDSALLALGKKTAAKAVARRVLKKAAEPTRDAMIANAPDDPNTPAKDLKSLIGISTVLNNAQRRADRKAANKSGVEVHVGTNDPAGWWQEFGTDTNPARPWARPAWLATRDRALQIIRDLMAGEIEKTARRLARKASKS